MGNTSCMPLPFHFLFTLIFVAGRTGHTTKMPRNTAFTSCNWFATRFLEVTTNIGLQPLLAIY